MNRESQIRVIAGCAPIGKVRDKIINHCLIYPKCIKREYYFRMQVRSQRRRAA